MPVFMMGEKSQSQAWKGLALALLYGEFLRGLRPLPADENRNGKKIA